MKKSYILMLLLTLLVGVINAQSPWAIEHSRKPDNTLKAIAATVNEDGTIEVAQASAVSARNLWIGSNVVWNVDQEAPIESPAVTGRLMYTAYSGDRFAIPILGNISLNDNGEVESPDEGVSIGAFPWYELRSSETFSLILHGGAGYRRYSEEGINLTEFKLLAGLELALSGEGGLPTTLGIAPVYRLNQGDLEDTVVLEVTGILPMGNGFGLMGQASFPFDGTSGDNSIFRLGAIVNGRL